MWYLLRLPLILLALTVGLGFPPVARAAAPTSLPNLILQLQQQHQGRLIGLEYETRQGEVGFRVELLTPQGQSKAFFIRGRDQAIESLSRAGGRPRTQPQRSVLSLDAVLKKAFGNKPYRLINAELEFKQGRYVYELDWIAPDGTVWEADHDAYTGLELKREREDD
jgi:uncharacterized membrane protein YkoI